MNWSDEELSAAFRRKQPPDGFAERVMAEIKKRNRGFAPRVEGFFYRPALRWALACAACVVLAISLVQYRHQRQVRVEGEIASAQAILALRIAGAQVHLALQQAQEITKQTIASGRKSKARLEDL